MVSILNLLLLRHAVPNSLIVLQQDWPRIQYRYELIRKLQVDAGDLLVTRVHCTKRLENSRTVRKSSKTARKARGISMIKGKPKHRLARKEEGCIRSITLMMLIPK